MIEIFSGVLGASKTCHATVRLVEALSQGRTVGTNIKLHWEKVVEYCRDEFEYEPDPSQYIYLEDEQIKDFYRHIPRGEPDCFSLAVIDDAALWFPAGQSASQVQRDMFNWARQSRKDKTDIIFTIQRIERLSLEFRELGQYFWKFKDMKRTAIFGGLRLPMFLELCYDEDRKIVQHRAIKPKDPRWFGLYDSDQMLRPFERPEIQARKGKKIEGKKRNMYKLVAILFVLLLGTAGTLFFKSRSVPAPALVKSVPVSVPSVSSVVPLGTPVSSKDVLPRFVRTGYYSGPDGFILLTDQGQFEREDKTPWGRVVDLGERYICFDRGGGDVVRVRVGDYHRVGPPPVPTPTPEILELNGGAKGCVVSSTPTPAPPSKSLW